MFEMKACRYWCIRPILNYFVMLTWNGACTCLVRGEVGRMPVMEASLAMLFRVVFVSPSSTDSWWCMGFVWCWRRFVRVRRPPEEPTAGDQKEVVPGWRAGAHVHVVEGLPPHALGKSSVSVSLSLFSLRFHCSSASIRKCASPWMRFFLSFNGFHRVLSLSKSHRFHVLDLTRFFMFFFSHINCNHGGYGLKWP